MPPEITSFLIYIFQVGISALAALLALFGLAPTKLGGMFLNHHLDKKLVGIRNKHKTEIEELRSRLSHLADRGIRSNEREYEAITAAREHFVDAYFATNTAIARMIEYPDFRRLSKEETVRFLSSTDLSKNQQDRVVEAKTSDQVKVYCDILTANMLNQARNEIWNARSVIRKKGIFTPDELRNQFEAAYKLFSAAQIAVQMDVEHNQRDGLKEVIELHKEAPQIFDDLLKAVRGRIHKE